MLNLRNVNEICCYFRSVWGEKSSSLLKNISAENLLPPHKQQLVRNWGGGINHLVEFNTCVFLTSTIGRVCGVSEGNWAHCQLQRQIKITHYFTAGYSWYMLSVCLSSGDKQSEGQTNTLTRYRCYFHAQNQQNRLRDRRAKCQTAAAAAGGLLVSAAAG